MIICGYSGIGKSTYCKTHNYCYDLDSSLFTKLPKWEEHYLKYAQQFSMSGYTVFISAHPSVIEYCKAHAIPVVVAIPAETKEVWELRLKLRYAQNHETYALNALRDFYQNYDRDMAYYNGLEGVQVIRVTCKVNTTLMDELKKVA